MPNLAGVDGCRAGWIAVVEDTDTRRITTSVFKAFAQLAASLDAAVIAVDIPIGLTERGPRECDVLARGHLGPKRGSSVFPAPIRPALYEPTYEAAKATSIAVQQKSISKQAWAIYPKIREVEEALLASADLRARVIEVHPELTFSTWSGAPILPSKKAAEGAATRQRLIAGHFDLRAFSMARAAVPRALTSDDDIADAFAALWTAERFFAGMARTTPASLQVDSRGLPMRMVH
jgi:predicted RNase H-like nuclease